MNLYISDVHFGHKSVIDFDDRPFADVDEMDDALIHNWNEKVQKNDDVYIIGDFAFRNEKPEEWYLRQLKGRKHLIVGNHDVKLLKNLAAISYFESIDMMKHVSDRKKQICLCHFPICEWSGYYKGHWHIYGHIHKRREEAYQIMSQKEKALNAACAINHYAPATFEELIQNNQRF